MPVSGLVTMTPTGSPAVVATGTGSSATVNANGSVTFSACETLSLNGVFTSSYDNYMITMRSGPSSAQAPAISIRLRSAGTDNATTSSYINQFLDVSSTTLTGSRLTSTSAIVAYTSLSTRSGFTLYIFGPNLAQETMWRSPSMYGQSSATLADAGGTHNQATSYDGLTFILQAGSLEGLVTVYGFNQ